MASVLEEYLNERSKNALVKISSDVETCDHASVCTLNIPNTLLCLWYRQKLSEDDIIRELNKATPNHSIALNEKYAQYMYDV